MSTDVPILVPPLGEEQRRKVHLLPCKIDSEREDGVRDAKVDVFFEPSIRKSDVAPSREKGKAAGIHRDLLVFDGQF